MHDSSSTDIQIPLRAEALRAWPLPMPSKEGDKEERGRVLIIGGSREMPGTMILAGNAALRAGAGKVAIAASESIVDSIAVAIPESRVIALPDPASSSYVASAAHALDKELNKIDSVLIGPGMQNEASLCELVLALLPRLVHANVILDAYAMGVVRNLRQSGPASDASTYQVPSHANHPQPRFLDRFNVRVLMTPHAGEMAHLTGDDKEAIQRDPSSAAIKAAQSWNAVVALKGAATCIATPDGRLWRHDGGNIGLAVSGSGDTLSGIIAGLAARGASLEQACAWGVWLHARAADQLAERTGPLGFLARDLASEVPMLMHKLRP